jgi:hypothetical protein
MIKHLRKKIKRKGGSHVWLGFVVVIAGVIGAYILITQFSPSVRPFGNQLTPTVIKPSVSVDQLSKDLDSANVDSIDSNSISQ